MPTRADELAGGTARGPRVGVDMWESPAQKQPVAEQQPHAVWTPGEGVQHRNQAVHTMLLVAREVHAGTRQLEAEVRTT